MIPPDLATVITERVAGVPGVVVVYPVLSRLRTLLHVLAPTEPLVAVERGSDDDRVLVRVKVGTSAAQATPEVARAVHARVAAVLAEHALRPDRIEVTVASVA